MLPLVEIPPTVKKYAEGYQDLYWEVPFPSKLDLACDLIDRAVARGYRYPVVMDSWYTCRQVCQHIAGKNMIYVGTLQPEAGVYLKGKWVCLRVGSNT